MNEIIRIVVFLNQIVSRENTRAKTIEKIESPMMIYNKPIINLVLYDNSDFLSICQILVKNSVNIYLKIPQIDSGNSTFVIHQLQ